MIREKAEVPDEPADGDAVNDEQEITEEAGFR